MRKMLAALAVALMFMFGNTGAVTAKDANPIFSSTKSVTLSKADNEKVTGKYSTASYYGYYGYLYAYYAYYYAYYGYSYNNASYYYTAYYYSYYATSYLYSAYYYAYYGY